MITVLLMFLMQYVNHFMIQRRKREFAIQSLLELEQSTIARLFLCGITNNGNFFADCGIGLGGVFSQFITAMLLQMYHKPFEFSFMRFSRYNHFDDSIFLHMFCDSWFISSSHDTKNKDN